jgi:hypothetical protein
MNFIKKNQSCRKFYHILTYTFKYIEDSVIYN